MSFQKKKQKKAQIRNRLVDVQRIAAEKESELEELREQFQQSYEALVDVKAKASEGIGGATDTDIAKARKKNQSIKKSIEALKEEIDVKNRTAELLQQEFNKANQAFTQAATDHYTDKLEPQYDNLLACLADAQQAIDNINEIRSEATTDGLQIRTHGIDHNTQPLLNKKRLSGPSSMNFTTIAKLTDILNK